MSVSDSDWKMPFSFAIFYRAVYQGNSQLNQYEIISILINGERLNTQTSSPRNAAGADMANHYVSGRKPISKVRVSALDALDEQEVRARIASSGIYNAEMGVRCIANLLRKDHIIISDSDRARLLSLENDPLPFLTDAFMLSVHCPVEQLRVLTKDIVADIIDSRAPVPRSNEPAVTVSNPTAASAIPATVVPVTVVPATVAPASSAAIRASYTLRELDYERDREEYRTGLIRLDAGIRGSANIEGRALSDEEVRMSTDLFRRADRTSIMDFTGTLSGLADVFLHRVSPGQCMQIVLICRVHADRDVMAMRRTLENIIHFALAEDGVMFLAWAPDESLASGEYNARLVYSIRDVSQEEQSRLEIVVSPAPNPLIPRKRFQGRVPDFLLSLPTTGSPTA